MARLRAAARPGARSLAIAARYADEYNTVYKTAEECAAIRRDLDAACSEQGREPIPLSLMTGWLVGEDEAEVLDQAGRLAEWRAHDGDARDFLATLPAAWITGTLDEVAERLDELTAAGVERIMAQHLLHRDVAAVEHLGRLSEAG